MLVQQNLGFVIHTYVVYFVESIPSLAEGLHLFLVWTSRMQENISFIYGLKQSHLSLAVLKRWISHHYKLFVSIFHEFDLSYYFPTTMKHPK